jgi:hypothetical protein
MIKPSFFIFGAERSGTTLLCALLSEHPQVFCLNDSFIFYSYAHHKGLKRYTNYWKYLIFSKIRKLPPGNSLVDTNEVEKYVSELIQTYNHFNPKDNPWLTKYSQTLEIQSILSQASQSEFTLSDLFNMIYAQLIPLDKQGDRIYGEKTPSHFYLSPWILNSLYPEAKTIVLIRNPITNVASIYKRRGQNLEKAIEVYLSYYDSRLDFLRKRKESITVRYEDLIGNQENTLKKIFEYLNVFSNEVSTQFDYFIKQHYIGNKVDPARDLKLQEMFDEHDKKLIKKRCSHIFEKFYSESSLVK